MSELYYCFFMLTFRCESCSGILFLTMLLAHSCIIILCIVILALRSRSASTSLGLRLPVSVCIYQKCIYFMSWFCFRAPTKVIERDSSGCLSARSFDENLDRRKVDPFSRSVPGDRWSELRSGTRDSNG